MRRVVTVIALAAALSGCSGGDGTPDRPVSRVTLGTVDQETFSGCPPITDKRLARQAIAFSGELTIEGPDAIFWVFDVDHWYTGGDEDVIVVRGNDVSMSYFHSTVQSGDGPDDPGETVGDGDRLLVAGPAGLTAAGVFPRERNGLASACLIQRWTPELAEQFERAFPTSSPRPTPRRGAG